MKFKSFKRNHYYVIVFPDVFPQQTNKKAIARLFLYDLCFTLDRQINGTILLSAL